MEIPPLRVAVLAVLSAAACSGVLAAAPPTAKRAFTVRDSIGMSYFGNIAFSTPPDLPDDGVVSPDGRYFVKITHRGVLPQGITEGTLWLFDTRAVTRSIRNTRQPVPAPTPLIRMDASVNGGLGVDVLDAGNTLIAPQWSADSRSLTFIGRNGRANRQVFKVDLATHALTELTPPNRDVLAYSRSGDEIVYLAGRDADRQAMEAWLAAGLDIPDVSAGTGTSLMRLLFPHFEGNAYGEPLDVELRRARDDQAFSGVIGTTAPPIRLTTRYSSLLLSLSPDATRAVTIAEDPRPGARAVGAGRGESKLRYQVIDLRSGEIKALGNAPVPDSHPTQHHIAWNAEDVPIVDGPVSTTRAPIVLTVREALNDPPVLVATDSKTGKSRQIFDPNPQLADLALGTVSVYRWRDPHGREDVGGLLLPDSFMRGRAYPLVIQTHGFQSGSFFRSGYSDTANAGRAFAARDILVLQVQEPHAEQPSWRDGTETGLDVYLAAVDKLAAEGLVDPRRVGISGYSDSGWLVANAIARAPQRFAAAEIANSDPVTLTGYYEYVGTPLAKVVADDYVGARPYADGLKAWAERSPAFATDKMTAPVLLQPADPWHLIGLWDIYAALVDQQKPVELQYIRGGEHNIRKPLEVLAHQEMLVDWFDYWLNSHEDADPLKAEQYERWRKVRALQAANSAQ